jgi:membrane associated rhomboid family serine protease
MTKNEKRKLIKSIILPTFFIIIIWVIKIIEDLSNFSFSFLGIEPLKFSGILGIFLSPFVHADFNHLWSNSFPVFILSSGILYFYQRIAFQVISIMWFLTGLGVWIMGREALHIGASGLIYSFTAFLFFSGIFRKYIPLIAISLLVIFLYGSIVWGIFPSDTKISWESHLMGFLSGLIIAYYFRNQGPQRKKFEWENDVPESLLIDNQSNTISKDTNFRYFYNEAE